MSDRAAILNSVVSVREILAYLQTDRYLDKREAAEYLSLSVRTVEENLDSIPHFKFNGKKVLFKRTELDAWMETQRASRTSKDIAAIADQAIAKWRAK